MRWKSVVKLALILVSFGPMVGALAGTSASKSYFSLGAPYAATRQALVRAGWKPDIFEIGLQNCHDSLCAIYPEFSNFYGTQPIPPRTYQVTWKKDGKYIQVDIRVLPRSRKVQLVSISCTNLKTGC